MARIWTIKNHILHLDGKPVSQKPTPNRGGAISPSLLVIHYTAGFTAASAIATLTNPNTPVSAHLVIDRDGSVTQLAPFNIKTWHAGDSAWKGRRMCNGFSIGFELVNVGPVNKRGDGKLVTEVANKILPPADVVEARHPNGESTHFWQVYPEVQFDVTSEIAKVVCDTYKIKEVAGHYDIAPKRKRDPGPAFSLSRLRARLFGGK